MEILWCRGKNLQLTRHKISCWIFGMLRNLSGTCSLVSPVPSTLSCLSDRGANFYLQASTVSWIATTCEVSKACVRSVGDRKPLSPFSRLPEHHLQNPLVPPPLQAAPTMETSQKTEYRRLVEVFQKTLQVAGRNHISKTQGSKLQVPPGF